MKPEQVEQEKAKALLRSMGAKLYVAGTTRKKGDHPGTMQTPGIPDLPFVFLPKRFRDGRRADGALELLVVEMKSPEAARKKSLGRSVEQIEFALECEEAGVLYYCGDFDGLVRFLVELKYLDEKSVAHYHWAKGRVQI